MEGRSMKARDERKIPEQSEIDCLRLATLLKNAIQLIHSGNEHTNGDQFDIATNPISSSDMANSGTVTVVYPQGLNSHSSTKESQ